MTELEKMKVGLPFNQTDPQLLAKMARTYLLVRRLNRTSLLNQPMRNWLLKRILGRIETPTYYVQSPLYVDYGFNTFIGRNFLSNYNLTIQDEGEVRIGDDVMIAPNVLLTTNLHPFSARERIVQRVPNRFPHNHKGNYVYAKPIHIEDNVWICAGVIVCPGVTIGRNSIIGAGSVVTKDVPPGVLAYGVPCKEIRSITSEEKTILHNKAHVV